MIGLGVKLAQSSKPQVPWWTMLYPGADMVADFSNNRSMIEQNDNSFVDFLNINRSSSGYAENLDGSLQVYGPNELRLSDKGILIESAKSNYILYSQDFSLTEWHLQGAALMGSLSLNAPDSTSTAQNILGLTNSGDGIEYRDSSTLDITSKTYTFSVYLRSNTDIDLELAVSATSGSGSPSLSAVSVTDEWQRFDLTHTYSNDDQDFICSITAVALPTSSHFEIWGAQFEEGHFASSYISTSGNVQIRTADAIQFSDLSWLDQTQGTIFMEVQSDQGSINNRRLLGFSSGRGLETSTSPYIIENWNGNIIIQSYSSNGRDFHTSVKFALSWDNGGRSLCIGSGIVGSQPDLLGSINNIYLGSRDGNNSFWEGYIRSLAYYPYRLSDSFLQTITQ